MTDLPTISDLVARGALFVLMQPPTANPLALAVEVVPPAGGQGLHVKPTRW
jgi:hypothetical protein